MLSRLEAALIIIGDCPEHLEEIVRGCMAYRQSDYAFIDELFCHCVYLPRRGRRKIGHRKEFHLKFLELTKDIARFVPNRAAYYIKVCELYGPDSFRYYGYDFSKLTPEYNTFSIMKSAFHHSGYLSAY